MDLGVACVFQLAGKNVPCTQVPASRYHRISVREVKWTQKSASEDLVFTGRIFGPYSNSPKSQNSKSGYLQSWMQTVKTKISCCRFGESFGTGYFVIFSDENSTKKWHKETVAGIRLEPVPFLCLAARHRQRSMPTAWPRAQRAEKAKQALERAAEGAQEATQLLTTSSGHKATCKVEAR